MYVCIYVFMYVCMHVCIYACIAYVCMYVCMYACMHACMHACHHNMWQSKQSWEVCIGSCWLILKTTADTRWSSLKALLQH